MAAAFILPKSKVTNALRKTCKSCRKQLEGGHLCPLSGSLFLHRIHLCEPKPDTLLVQNIPFCGYFFVGGDSLAMLLRQALDFWAQVIFLPQPPK
jgi:hypothetical protein